MKICQVNPCMLDLQWNLDCCNYAIYALL